MQSANFPGWQAMVPVTGATLLLAGNGDGRVGRLLAARPLRWLGQRSYSLYLWHWPIFSLVDYAPYAAAAWQRLLLKLGASLLLTIAIHALVERPARA